MAFGNAKQEQAALLCLYEDTVTITRQKPQKGQDGITRQQPQPVYTDVVCGLSVRVGVLGANRSRQNAVYQEIDWDAVLFLPPEVQVLPGDNLTVRRFGRDDPQSKLFYRFEAVGVAAVYQTHTEVKARQWALA